jgi:hypothetical protein
VVRAQPANCFDGLDLFHGDPLFLELFFKKPLLDF